jgi:hypothetical protein
MVRRIDGPRQLVVEPGCLARAWGYVKMSDMTTRAGKKLKTGKLKIGFSGFLCFGVAIALLGGCTLLPPSDREEAAATIYDRILPVGWTALGTLQAINLDDDEEDEHLLLFRFDNGQVGALVLEGDPATSISPPEHLLPRYFDDQGNLGQGIIAPPGTPASAITLTVVSGNSPARELTVLANGTNLTFAWWRGQGLGYGVTQLHAPGGFGVDWETWQKEPEPISSVMGYYPLEDYRARANLCRLVLYTRRTDLPSGFPAIVFSEQSQGLHFCNSTIPTYPFAPEGVVMAYLRWPRADAAAIAKLLTPGTTVPQLDAESAYERLAIEQIKDIAAYPSVPVRGERAAASQPESVLTTVVCVEFAETANATLRRWVLYTLRYQPQDAGQQLPERWTVSGAVAEPLPPEPPSAGYCNTILERNAP